MCAHLCAALQVAVFGFCDIRRFTDTTEVLQEGVMEFVNVIAHLVHSAVAARGGAANKSIGDAFLLVRLVPSSDPYMSQRHTVTHDGHTALGGARSASMRLVSCLRGFIGHVCICI
jgi:class 3 adenylate cyclase